MRKFIFPVFAFLFLICSCDKQDNKTQAHELADNKIYFFYYNECPYCHDAMEYMNKKYPDLKVTLVNIYNNGGFELFKACAAKFNLGKNIGTPLFCMGNNYIMGWSDNSARQFDDYVKPFL